MIRHYDKGRASISCLLVDMLLFPDRQGAGFQGYQIKPSLLHSKASAFHGIYRLTEGLSSCSGQWSTGVGDLQMMPFQAEVAGPTGGTRWRGET